MKDKKFRKKISGFIFSAIAALSTPFLLMGCSTQPTTENVFVTGISKSTTDGGNNYLITYSNGTSSTITIENGKDGSDVTIDDILKKYKEEYGEIEYNEFLNKYLSISTTDNSRIANECLLSCLKVYTEFYTTQDVSTISSWSGFYPPTVRQEKVVNVMCGSAVIYKIEDDFTYVITNYHVVYSANVNEDNGSNFAHKIVGYLYGSDGTPKQDEKNADGYIQYDYGQFALNFTLVGGSVDHDIAILKVPTEDMININPNAKAVTMAETYYVGETAIAIGNPENAGISVTEGVISVDNEYIQLNIDGNTRNYRTIRMDTAIYGGSSGGGLFNSRGELIGITNAGDGTDQNINYAVPLDIVKNVTDNILYYYDGTNTSTVKKIFLGITPTITDSRYVYDSSKGYGNIIETIAVKEITANSIAANWGLAPDDTLVCLIINDEEHNINRNFEMRDLILTIRAGDNISIKYIRKGTECVSPNYTVKESDLTS
ncbi:MAG: trypsin-like peptidase domain-containing protein [Clostridia bacterium]|nr:trypsin-like peptidase domain-containing protein [Clostridia bacterium]